MLPSTSIWNRPVTRIALLVFAFGMGMMVERSPRWLLPYLYPPPSQEKLFEPFWQAWYLIEHRYVDREAVDPQRMVRGAIHGLADSLGDTGHTGYLSPEERTRLEEILEGQSVVGIGAQLGIRNGRPFVARTFPGSPARAAGLQTGDFFVTVDGRDVHDIPFDKLASVVRGPEKTQVHLRMERPGQAEPIDFDITRARVDVPDVSWTTIPGQPILLVAINSFGMKSHEQLVEALEDGRKQGVKGMIIDVRGNTGGLKDQAVSITSEFLASGNVFISQDADGTQTPVPVEPGGHATDWPMVVLVDDASASSSEILAGAIQDHERGKLVGIKTFGTGTVLQQFRLADGSALLLAVAQWLTPKGRKIWHHGITPDVVVALSQGVAPLQPETGTKLTAEALASSRDVQLQRALDILRPQLQ